MQIADEQVMQSFQAMSGGNNGDERLFVQFSMEPEHNVTKSNEAGRPVYDEIEYIRIQVPGDKDNVVFRTAYPEDRRRFPKQYAAFKQNQETPVSGTPLSVLPFLSKAQVMEFAVVGVKTAEQLMGMSDANGQRFMGIQELKKRIGNFLEAAAGAAPALKLQAELEKRDGEIATLKKMMEEQSKQIEKLQRR